MTERDRPDFVGFLTAMFNAVGRTVDKETLRFYWQMLSRFELREIKQAVGRFRPSGAGFAPTPWQIAERIEGSHPNRSRRAWAEVEKAIQAHGAYQSIAFEDQITLQVILDMGGWIRLCSREINDFTAKEFSERYVGYLQTGGPHNPPKYLAGIVERDHRSGSRKYTEPPALVGDKEIIQKRLEASEEDKSGKVLQHLMGVTKK